MGKKGALCKADISTTCDYLMMGKGQVSDCLASATHGRHLLPDRLLKTQIWTCSIRVRLFGMDGS